MSLKSILQNRSRNRTFRRIRKGKKSILDLPPYERGLYYENVVCRWLKGRGYHILDRNYRGRRQTEIDIIAKDGETLVFIEVKARRRFSVYSPLRAVDRRKRQSLALAVIDYMRQLQLTGIDVDTVPVRYDLIAVALDENGMPCAIDQYLAYLIANDECF